MGSFCLFVCFLHQSPACAMTNRMVLTAALKTATEYKHGSGRLLPVEPGLQVAAEILRWEDGVFKHREAVHMVHCQCQFGQV